MLAEGLEILILLLSLVALLYQGAAIVLAYEMPRLGPAAPGPSPPGESLLVVIAARDEEEEIGRCLDALARQELEGFATVVVDGCSTDRTREIVRLRAPAVRLLEEPPLPEGWVGKNWASSLGAGSSGSEWILFLDADVRLHPATLRTALGWAEREGADLATLAPTVETVGIWERIVMPFYIQMVLTYFRTPHVNRDRSPAAMANGQFLLVRRSAYEALGGHAAVRSAVLEDVRLAELFKRQGRRLRVAYAPDLLVTRMYRDRREMFEGLLKNVHGGRFSALRQVAFLAGLVGFFWLPLAVLPLGLLEGSLLLSLWGAFLVVALFGKHVAFDRGVGGSGAMGLLFPVAVGYYLELVGVSLVRGIRGRPLGWKGRHYPLER